MSSQTILGYDLQAVQEIESAKISAFPINSASTLYMLGVPAGFGPIRIVKVSWIASAVLNDADGTMLVSVIARKGGVDNTIVNAASVEGGTAHAVADFTLAAETTAKEQTLNEGDSVRVTFTNNSAAIDTNGALTVFVHFHPIPNDNVGNDVKHQSNYR